MHVYNDPATWPTDQSRYGFRLETDEEKIVRIKAEVTRRERKKTKKARTAARVTKAATTNC
jgi:hypothetical protein